MTGKQIKKGISLLLCLAVVLSLAACGNNSTSIENVTADNAATDDSTTADVNTTADGDDATVAENVVSQDDETIYLSALSDFYELYNQSLSAGSSDERYALMAAAEAKFLESGTGIPMYTAGAYYVMTRIVYRSGGYALWSGEETDYAQYLITNEIITVDDYAYLKQLWNEKLGTGTYRESAVAYLEEQGYTFSDTYTNVFSDLGATWDVLSSATSVDESFIAPGIDYLFGYDSEGELQPHLAERCEVSEDGLTYTFYIRQGLSWTDSQGRKVADLVADDWVAAAQHMADTYSDSAEDLVGRVAGMAEYINGETTDFSTVGIQALDDYTLQYTLSEPCDYFLSMMESSTFMPMSRSYYQAMGGVFGIAQFETASTDASYLYGKDQDHIAYCGAYLCTNVTEKNSVNYVASSSYWNADNITIKNIKLTYDDGSDITRNYTNFLSGVTTTIGLNTAQIETAKTDGYFEQYAVVSDTMMNTFLFWCNMNRQTYANVADGGCASTKTEQQKACTYAALQNQHFRLALSYSIDRATYMSQSVGETLKYSCLRNEFVPSTFLMLEGETTVDVLGQTMSFPAGSYYGEIVQAVLNADGCSIKVWDEESQSGDGFDGWYDVDAAAAEIALAVEELAAQGIQVATDNPIVIDYPYSSYNEVSTNQAYVLKSSIETATGGLVELSLIGCSDSTENRNVWFNTQNGSEYNYDLGGLGGMGASYGDPMCYLESLLPYGDGGAVRKMGLW